MSDFSKLCKLFNNLIFYLSIGHVGETPQTYDVYVCLIEIDAKWKEIGIGLRVPNNFLESLTQENVSNKVKLNHVLQKWIELDGQVTSDGQAAPVNWKSIINVVRDDLDNKKLAMNIYKYLKHEQNATGKHNYFLTFPFMHHAVLTESQMEQDEKQSSDFGVTASQETGKL